MERGWIAEKRSFSLNVLVVALPFYFIQVTCFNLWAKMIGNIITTLKLISKVSRARAFLLKEGVVNDFLNP